MTKPFVAGLASSVVAAILLMAAMSSAIAACKAGDLTGKWNLYALLARSPTVTLNTNNTVKYLDNNTEDVLWCSLTFAAATAMTYKLSGKCNGKSVLNAGDGSPVTMSGTLAETTSCHLTGAFRAGAINMTILDAKIDDSGSARSRGTGVWRFRDGSNGQGVQPRYTVAIFHLQK